MSQPATNVPVSRPRLRVQLNRFKSRRPGMFGIAEIIGLAGAVFLLLVVILGYFYFLLPARSRVNLLLSDRDALQKELRFSDENLKRGMDTKATVQKITESLSDFEENRLVGRSEGRMSLYEELNQLIHRNGLRNTSGPTYAALEPIGSKTQQASANSAAAKWQSIYPGIAVNVTVEGTYQSLRHFVRDIEASKQFLIINAVELERATESNAPATMNSGTPKSAATLVSLRLDLATYFQRGGNSSIADSEQPSGVH